MYRPILQRIPLPAGGHIIRSHRYNLLYTKTYSFDILFDHILKSVYLLTRAPAPPMMPSTSSTVAMEVSPGVVIASAPCAAP